MSHTWATTSLCVTTGSKMKYWCELVISFFLVWFRLKDFAPALKHIADIIERGIREHPELGVGMQTEGIEVIIEKFNLGRRMSNCFSHF